MLQMPALRFGWPSANVSPWYSSAREREEAGRLGHGESSLSHSTVTRYASPLAVVKRTLTVVVDLDLVLVELGRFSSFLAESREPSRSARKETLVSVATGSTVTTPLHRRASDHGARPVTTRSSAAVRRTR
jgi:hypothetical protein